MKKSTLAATVVLSIFASSSAFAIGTGGKMVPPSLIGTGGKMVPPAQIGTGGKMVPPSFTVAGLSNSASSLIGTGGKMVPPESAA